MGKVKGVKVSGGGVSNFAEFQESTIVSLGPESC
jgi:hypothetical protein